MDNLALGLALGGALRDVRLRARALLAQTADRDHVQAANGVAVAAVVEAVADGGPDDAGIGLEPQSAAIAGSLRSPLDVLATVTSSCPAYPVAMPSSWVAWRGAGDEVIELLVELRDLCVESWIRRARQRSESDGFAVVCLTQSHRSRS